MREQILEILRKTKNKFTALSGMVNFFANQLGSDKETVKMVISKLIKNGAIYQDTQKVYRLTGKKLLKGKIIGNERGFAFCSVSGQEDDYFIPARKLNGALNGDIVLIRPLFKGEQSQEAEVVQIVQSDNSTVVGKLCLDGQEYYLEADNKRISRDIKIVKGKTLNASAGNKVVVKIVYQTKDEIFGEVVELLGNPDDLNAIELGIIREHKLYEEFPEDVMAEAQAINQTLTQKDYVNRRDLTKEMIFTIDGEDARDFDDAVNIKKLDNGNYLLGVHIADVTHYVKESTRLDEEALLRATSVYFPNMVLPMLPKELSNGICSLNENVPRLTLSVEMEISNQAEIVKYDIFESVIKSVKRLTYTEVYAVLTGDKETTNRLSHLKEQFVLMQELSEILTAKRNERGALDLDLPETYFDMGKEFDIKGVKVRERNDAHRLIESFMVVCNEVVAKHFHTLELPFVYRVHEVPVQAKLLDVLTFMKGIGLVVPPVPKELTPKYYQQLLACTEDKAVQHTIHKIILRSLQKAKYLPECLGHFGLASSFYCHFTSPIRRYPDLAIHRIIKKSLHKEINSNNLPYLEEFVFDASDRSSERERSADEAERDIDDFFKAIYMQQFIGNEFEGIVSGVTNYGFYVELNNSVEGLVRIEDLPEDNYLYFEKSLKLVGQNHTYTIGDNVKIKVVASNVLTRKIDFVIG